MKVQFVDLIVARLKTHPQAIRFLIKRGGGGGGGEPGLHCTSCITSLYRKFRKPYSFVNFRVVDIIFCTVSMSDL